MAHPVSRFYLFAGLLAAALMAIGTPAMAAKKRKAKPAGSSTTSTTSTSTTSSTSTTTPTAGSPTSDKPADGAAQAQDQERPKPILEESPEIPSPKADAQGNVNFVGAKGGHGKITVKAPVAEKAKVYLEGRYFGLAPRTINKIPPGDYIIEVTYPSGKSVTKPVSVSGDEEAVVELGGAADIAGPAEKPMAMEKIEKRLSLAKGVGIGAIGLAVVGVGLGIWEYSVQQDYNKKANSSQGTQQDRENLDSLSKKGDRLALGANICFVGAAVGLIAAGIIGYPAYRARKSGAGRSESPDVPPPISFMLAPGRTLGSVNAGMLYRF